ncbi:hypothetical protein [Lysobacter gummosus]|uniref:hypothetical protein n=1 Tax=Lysobacter gummosus TaxID=262324 RepID=UPI003627EE36
MRVACTCMSARRRMRRRSGAANPTCSRRANADHDIRWNPLRAVWPSSPVQICREGRQSQDDPSPLPSGDAKTRTIRS